MVLVKLDGLPHVLSFTFHMDLSSWWVQEDLPILEHE